jgi:hypothetical protein
MSGAPRRRGTTLLPKGGLPMTFQGSVAAAGRPVRKFTPANIRKIEDWVAEGFSRNQIAELLSVTVGSLQVTCSRLGISLRRRELCKDNEARRLVGPPRIHPPSVKHMGAEPQYPRIQIVLEHNGLRRVTDVPLGERDIVRLGLEASVQNLGMVQLLTHAVTMAIKKDMIERILHE